MGNGIGNAEITLNKVSNRSHGGSTFCEGSTNMAYNNRNLITKIHFNHRRPIVIRCLKEKNKKKKSESIIPLLFVIDDFLALCTD